MGPLMLPGFMSKSCGATWPTCAQVGHLTGQANQVAGLDGRAHFLGGLGQIVHGLGLVGQLLGLLAEQHGQLLVAVVVEHVGLPVGKVGRVGRGDAGDLEDRVALAGRRRLRRIALLGFEGLGDHLRAVGQRGDDALLATSGVVVTCQVMCGGGLLQAVLDRLGGERLGVVLLGLRRLLADQRCLDGGQHLVQRLGVAGWRSSTCTM